MKFFNTMMILAVIGLITACGGNKQDNEATENGEASEIQISDITFYLEQETTITEAGGSMTMLAKGWHDLKNDYFAIEMEYNTFFDGEKVPHRGLYLQNNTGTYQINLITKTGYKLEDYDLDDYDNPMELYEEDPLSFEESVAMEGGKIIGKELILNKECIIVEFTDEDDDHDDGVTTMRHWFYKGIPLKTVGDGVVVETLKFEEGATVPAGAFNIPEGVTIR